MTDEAQARSRVGWLLVAAALLFWLAMFLILLMGGARLRG
jgi:hypothetical protein